MIYIIIKYKEDIFYYIYVRFNYLFYYLMYDTTKFKSLAVRIETR